MPYYMTRPLLRLTHMSYVMLVRCILLDLQSLQEEPRKAYFNPGSRNRIRFYLGCAKAGPWLRVHGAHTCVCIEREGDRARERERETERERARERKRERESGKRKIKRKRE